MRFLRLFFLQPFGLFFFFLAEAATRFFPFLRFFEAFLHFVDFDEGTDAGDAVRPATGTGCVIGSSIRASVTLTAPVARWAS